MRRKCAARKIAHFLQSANVCPSDENATAFSGKYLPNKKKAAPLLIFLANHRP
jgi:hypothetical protein